MRSLCMLHLWILAAASQLATGCSAIPDISHQPQYHNPFPQLSRVAVLPFYNQSNDPTVDGDQFALAYYNELQEIRGFEVMPVGVAKRLLEASGMVPVTGLDYQKLALFMDVDAIVVGSVTEFSPYYPPRLGLAIRWYAANPGFYPIPPGYGLPWGTSEEEFIPDALVFEAEFALAKEQLNTQTPENEQRFPLARTAPAQGTTPPPPIDLDSPGGAEPRELAHAIESLTLAAPGLPTEWPDPRGFVPPVPSQVRPESIPQSEPVLSLTRLYRGNDSEFTKRLANYFYFRDDARFGDWQAYLQRSEDFIRFCCHLHVTELLASRGGAGKTRVVWRWPIGRYHR